MTAAQKKKRTANRLSRQQRREEIQLVWDKRRARRALEFWLAQDTQTPLGIVNAILEVSAWYDHAASHPELVDVLNPALLRDTLSCALRIIELKEMPYAEYLRTPEWQTRATAAKERFDGKCVLDESHPADDAHHRTYTRRGREAYNDIIPVCRACHSKFHDRG